MSKISLGLTREAAESAMADEPDNIILVYLRRLDEKLDRVAEDVKVLKTRMTSVEERLASVEMRLASVEMSIAGVNRRIDRVEGRLDRIEKRLDLTEVPR